MKDYLAENLKLLKNDIFEVCKRVGRDVNEIKLIAVSKTFPVEDIQTVFNAGQVDFGENKPQEMKEKFDELHDKNIRWHMIGHLQTNKVKYIADYVYLIHSVDSEKLAEEIQKQAEKRNKVLDVLVQVNTSDEMQKSGVDPDKAEKLCRFVSSLVNVRLCGLMTIGKFTYDKNIIRGNFKDLKKIYDELKPSFPDFKYLSMGMTSDYEIAIEEGANLLRIGSAIFGKREYEIT
ncbi:MAG: YggS family pyridoxal phosphate-dependent enzyme [Bacteroidetes bacterium]|nr:YggS family pyridoxal phosphate-dependent enzyme [Bacteroidota bacterium]